MGRIFIYIRSLKYLQEFCFKVLELVDEIVNIYSNNANNKQRLGSYIDSIGFDTFKSMINLDKYIQ